MAVRWTILGSGSAGNCAYLEAGNTRLLIDAGLSARQIRLRLAALGRVVESLTGVLITHEHSDHTEGLKVLAARHDIPIYCNRFTREAIEAQMGLRLACRVFETGAAFCIGDVEVESFSVPHDAQDPVGFLVRTNSGNVGVITDLGHVTRLVLERMRPANVLLVEANHDVRLLQEDTKRPWATKQRILSRHGHLSNEAAAAMVEALAGENLKHVFLGHLSRDCNRPELARAAVVQRLERLGARHIQLSTAAQDTPTPELTF